MTLRTASAADAAAVAAIYNPFILETTVTFEEEPISVTALEERMAAVLQSGFPWLIAEEEGRVIGYAYGKLWHPRSAYRFTAESSVYLPASEQGRGTGVALYRELLLQLKAQGIRNVLGCITLPNDPSVRLHEKLGFQKIGHFPGVGFKFGQWQDVGFWQLRLEDPSL
jgi:L-amino acid N-acyltransferase YncA